MLQDWALRNLKTNIDIRDFVAGSNRLKSEVARRSLVKIAVIDDQPFGPQTNLKSYGYDVTPIGDLKSLSEIVTYHMILCDIIGVGRHFDSNMQGASLIKEIKLSYPEKVVIAYTGAGLNERAAKLAHERADAILKKDSDIEEWIATLDKFSIAAVDPYQIWNKVRRRFVEMNVDTKEIIVLENLYVRSILDRDSGLTSLNAKSDALDLRQDVRAIIQGLAASLIFKQVFGG